MNRNKLHLFLVVSAFIISQGSGDSVCSTFKLRINSKCVAFVGRGHANVKNYKNTKKRCAFRSSVNELSVLHQPVVLFAGEPTRLQRKNLNSLFSANNNYINNEDVYPESSDNTIRSQNGNNDSYGGGEYEAINGGGEDFDAEDEDYDDYDDDTRKRVRIRQSVSKLARRIVTNPISVAPKPKAIGMVIKDATLGALDLAVEEVIQRRASNNQYFRKYEVSSKENNRNENDDGSVFSSKLTDALAINVSAVIEEIFRPMEASLQEMEDALYSARNSLNKAKLQARSAMEAVHTAVQPKTVTASAAVENNTAMYKNISSVSLTTSVSSTTSSSGVNVSALADDDLEWKRVSPEMAPPFLDENQCLVPGEPLVRVEKAPENSRRIFAGIDIMAGVDDVWDVLTDYANLQNVVPSLMVNDVLKLYNYKNSSKSMDPLHVVIDATRPSSIQCQTLAQQMKGALLRQVGGAKVAGIQFSARTTLEVREWPFGLPDFTHFCDEMWQGKSRKKRAVEYSKLKLQRYEFPRPFAISKLPTRDITMQSIDNDDGEFRLYQGVWRMQPLPGCAPPGKKAMRLTYAVEVSPRAYLPVQLIERRIVRDLCNNLESIRDYVERQHK